MERIEAELEEYDTPNQTNAPTSLHVFQNLFRIEFQVHPIILESLFPSQMIILLLCCLVTWFKFHACFHSQCGEASNQKYFYENG